MYNVYGPKVDTGNNLFNVSLKEIVPSILKTAYSYPDLFNYFLRRPVEEDCELKFALTSGANFSKLTANGVSLIMKATKPLCVQDDNNLMYLDLTGSQLPGTIPVMSGLKKLKYLSLENTGMKKLPNTFLQYYPTLEVLKLSKVDIGSFIRNIDGNFFGSCPTLEDLYLHGDNLTKIPTTTFSRSVNLRHLDISKNYLSTFDTDLRNCTKLNILNLSHNVISSISKKNVIQLSRLASAKMASGNHLVVDLKYNKLQCLCNSTHFIRWLQRSPADSNVKFHDFDSYTCLYPNGSIVRVSEVSVGEVERQCGVVQTLVNGSDCPCDEEKRRRLQKVWVHLEGFFCRNDAGVLVAMNIRPLPSCFNPYKRASFIAPVVVGGILGIAVFIAVGLLIYYRNTRRVRQVRECLEMNPVRFVLAALQYAMMNNRDEQHVMFRYDMIVFAQDEDRASIHNRFIEALRGNRRFITRDDFLAGVAEVEAMAECIRVCQWIVPVLTTNFLSDPVCIDFINRVQFSRPHALIPVVWQKPLEVADVSVAELLRTSDALYWPGDLAVAENKRTFWSSLLDRTIS